MFQVSNVAAQLMVGSLLGRGILYFKGRIRGDVLRHVFSPDDFLRKQIKAERGKVERR
jgi:membrane protein DedA with SNARE-associated domain